MKKFSLFEKDRIECKPFIKWVGGKGQLLPEISKLYPTELGKTINKYAEIFIGGGAVLFDILSKYKLDEIPQLINVLIGDMSLVGPRPEVPKYVALYTDEQKEILKVRAGITDYASIEFSNENDLLALEKDSEKAYIEKIMPKKIELNKKYLSEISMLTDIRIILLTIKKILK